MRARGVDVLCGYALQIAMDTLRTLRAALEQLLDDDPVVRGREQPVSTSDPLARAPAPNPAYATPRSRARAPETGSAEGPRRVPATPPLSDAYEDDRLVLLVRDPRTLFAYWDLVPGATRPPDGEAVVLRVYDLTFLEFSDVGPWRHLDFEVDRLVGSRYVTLDRDAGTYRAEIGWRHADGSLHPRARSVTVTTARAVTAGRDPVRWLTVHLSALRDDGSASSAGALATHPAPTPPGAPSSAATRVDGERAPSSEEHARRGG